MERRGGCLPFFTHCASSARMKRRKLLLSVLGLAVVAGFASCSMNFAGGGIHSYKTYDRSAALPRDPSAVEVKVSLSRQRVYVMEGEKMLLIMPVTVGKATTPTPEGDFRIYNKTHKYRSTTHGYAAKGDTIKMVSRKKKPAGWAFRGEPLPYWCEFKPNFAFHTGWVKHSPASNGCIRMHENLAPKFFRLVSKGTPVNISYRQPEDEEHSNILLPPDAGPLPDYPGEMYFGDDYFTRHLKPEFH